MKIAITIKQSENSKLFKDIYINGEYVGMVIADDKMTPYECYEALKSNWEIDEMERQSDDMIDRCSNY